jgi:hypothetical protein
MNCLPKSKTLSRFYLFVTVILLLVLISKYAYNTGRPQKEEAEQPMRPILGNNYTLSISLERINKLLRLIKDNELKHDIAFYDLGVISFHDFVANSSQLQVNRLFKNVDLNDNSYAGLIDEIKKYLIVKGNYVEANQEYAEKLNSISDYYSFSRPTNVQEFKKISVSFFFQTPGLQPFFGGT